MKRKQKIWLWVGISFSLLIIIGLLVLKLVLKWETWKAFWIPTTFIGGIWFIGIIIWLIIISNRGEQVVKNILTREIEQWHIERIKDNEYLADNFILKEREVGNFGDPSKSVTPVLLMIGHLTEKEQDMAIIINLNNPKEQFTDKFRITKEDIERLKEMIADNPDKTIKEDIKFLNAFGNPMGNISRTLPSSQKERDKINEEKVAEEKAI